MKATKTMVDFVRLAAPNWSGGSRSPEKSIGECFSEAAHKGYRFDVDGRVYIILPGPRPYSGDGGTGGKRYDAKREEFEAVVRNAVRLGIQPPGRAIVEVLPPKRPTPPAT